MGKPKSYCHRPWTHIHSPRLLTGVSIDGGWLTDPQTHREYKLLKVLAHVLDEALSRQKTTPNWLLLCVSTSHFKDRKVKETPTTNKSKGRGRSCGSFWAFWSRTFATAAYWRSNTPPPASVSLSPRYRGGASMRKWTIRKCRDSHFGWGRLFVFFQSRYLSTIGRWGVLIFMRSRIEVRQWVLCLN